MKHFYNLFSSTKRFKSHLQSLTAGFAFLFAGYHTAEAQVSAYGFAQTTGSYTPITGTVLGTATGNTSATNLNSAVYPVTLPFNFLFNGVSYSSLNVSTNGFITFGATPPATTTTTPISGTVAYEGAISAWGRDISSFFNVAGVTGNISWETTGTAPNREVVIQWKNFRANSATAVTSVFSFSFQIKLQETSNVIKIVYDGGSYLIGNTAVDLTAQIGLRGSSNADFKNRLNEETVAFTNSVQGIANNSLQAFNTVNAVPGMPTAGLTYTYTPATCLPPTNVSVNTITPTTANIAWTASTSAPANGYDVYYSTSSTPPLNSETPQYTGAAGTSQIISGLTPATVYYVWVRSVCGTSNISEWSLSATFPSGCNPMTTMFENFDSYGTGNIVPMCWTRIVGASNTAQTISSTSPASGTRNLYQITSTAANATVVVLPEFSNVNAGTHWLRFKARVASATGTLDVGYVTSTTDASTFVNIQTINILNTSYTAQDSEYTVIVPNTIPATARLAIRNIGTSTVGHFYDDVYWEAKPSCISPTNIMISNITSSSVNLQWDASVSAPANGYDIYFSTTDTAPTVATVPSTTVATGTSATITPLLPSTKYFVWVRSRCSVTDFSAWSTQIVMLNTLCQPPTFTTTGATVCLNQPANLSVTAPTGTSVTWYDSATAGNVVGTGTTYTTPALSTTTQYYATVANSSLATTGKTDATSTSGYTLDAGLLFDVYSDITINGVYVYPIGTGAGTVEIALQNGNVLPATTLQSTVVNLTGSASPYVKTFVPLNFSVTPGVNYKLMMIVRTGGVSSLVRESGATWGSYPFTIPGAMAITAGNLTNNDPSTSYYYFYDWQVTKKCESSRTMVTATVDSNCLSTAETGKKDAVKVYPNPFSEVVNITKPELVKSIRVSDLSGKLIRTINQPESVLRLQDLSAGLYILQLDMKDGSKQTIKIIKK